MFKKLLGIAIIGGTLLATGCASVPMATPEQDTQAKSFTTTADKANIYIYRNETMGAAVKMPVSIDGTNAGETVAESYILKSVAPGNHTILSSAENDATLPVTVEAGKNYFIWQEVKMGVLSARSALHSVDSAEGKKGVSECKLVQ